MAPYRYSHSTKMEPKSSNGKMEEMDFAAERITREQMQ